MFSCFSPSLVTEVKMTKLRSYSLKTYSFFFFSLSNRESTYFSFFQEKMKTPNEIEKLYFMLRQSDEETIFDDAIEIFYPMTVVKYSVIIHI